MYLRYVCYMCVCMYCMHVCVCRYTHVCMHVCMYRICIYVCMSTLHSHIENVTTHPKLDVVSPYRKCHIVILVVVKNRAVIERQRNVRLAVTEGIIPRGQGRRKVFRQKQCYPAPQYYLIFFESTPCKNSETTCLESRHTVNLMGSN